MFEFLRITKALSDKNRLRILLFLRGGELCLCQIIDMLGLAPSTVSKHMSILHQAGLIQARKNGRWRYFRLSGNNAPRHIKKCLKWIHDTLVDEEIIVKDSKRLEKILEIPVEEFCRKFSAAKK